MMKQFILLSFLSSLFFQLSYQVSVKQLGSCFPNKYGSDAECYHRIRINDDQKFNYSEAMEVCRDPDNQFADDINAFLPEPKTDEERLTLRRLLFWQNIDDPIYVSSSTVGESREVAFTYNWKTGAFVRVIGNEKLPVFCQRRKTAKISCQPDFHLIPNSQACFASFGSYQHLNNGESKRYTFNDCQKKCNSHNSQLATFDNIAEYDLIKNIAKRHAFYSTGLERTAAATGSTIGASNRVLSVWGMWIGIRLPARVGDSWVNEKPTDLAYFMDGCDAKDKPQWWREGEPSNGGFLARTGNDWEITDITEHCVEFFPHQNVDWNDEDCSTKVEGCACRAMADQT